MTNDPAYTPPQIAKLLRVKPATVLAWIARGELVASNVGSGATRPRWRIMPADLERFLASRRAVVPVKVQRRKKQQAYTRYF